MEWTMPVNDIFDEEVTKITATMLPEHFSGDVRTTRSVQEQIAKLIDTLGEESASSQGLNKVITSADKLRNNPKHTIYLLKDHRGNKGLGEIIGLLKVGRKHLFLFDAKECVHEVEPLCVLDFYIVRDRQRMGFGRMLFDFMLHELELTANQVAIDGPSDKMELFLARNFGVKKLLRQNNNFAVAPSFFDRSDDEISKGAGDAPEAAAAAVGRFAAPQPPSAIANVIHGAGHEEANRRSPSPAAAAAQPAAPPGAAGEPRACTSPGGRVYVGFRPMELWDDEEEPSEPGFYPDQPAAERRDEMSARRHSPSALERPGSLAVQAPAEPANVPAAGMPSGGGSTARCAAGNITYAQCAAGVPPSRAAGALSAAGTPSGSGDRRDSQLTNKGTPTPAAAAAAPAEPAADPAADPVETRASRPVETRASRPVERRYGPAVVRPEVSPGGTIYIGFTPPHILMLEDEEDSGPEPDDATYEYYEFDPDQPASERRDDMRMRGPYY